MAVRYNDDEKIVKTIKEGLKAKNGYCPCRRETIPENKCMCKEFRDQIADPDFEGYCHCMLYYKSKESEKMEFKVGTKYHGFTVDRVRKDEKAGGLFIEMTHDATGARLCYSKNSEENKLFSVAFKTIPEDSTGVFHILEHSVLCGSDKYPVKEPFVELLKSSMNTFLNAMTFPDKTIYPVSSRNTRDFLNLTEVYLDAVFAPAMLKNKNVFLQEGRRLEVNDGVPSFNGVVLNEMRGATSEADDVMYENTTKLLFPDNCYRFNSGGDPAEIPELTYEKFVETYKKFYHPSNSYFYLDGDIPEEETFSLIESYLDRYEREEVTWDVAYQRPQSGEMTTRYGSDETDSPKDMLSVSKIVADYSEIEKIFAIKIICDFLASSNEAPLKRAVLSSGLAEDFEVFIPDEDGFKQIYISLTARNTKDEDADKLKKLIFDELKRIAEAGIPREDLVACVNRAEFSFRQMSEPKGLFRNIIALNSWLYGGDPMLYLDVDPVFRKLREMIDDGSYDRILKDVFADETDYVTLRVIASSEFAAETAKREADYAASVYSAMTDEEKALHAEESRRFCEWQNTPDTEEGIATIPVLPLSEVSDTPKEYHTEEFRVNGVKTLYHKVASNGIVYFSVYAPLTQFSAKELSLLSLLPALFTQLPTSDYSVSDLQREIKTYLGDFSASCQVISEYGQTEHCMPALVVSASALEENLEKAESLVAQIINGTLFNEPSRIHEIVKQVEEANRQRIVYAGHLFAVSAARSTLSSEGAASEAVKGITMMKAIKKLNAEFDENVSSLVALFERVIAESFTKENVTVSFTCGGDYDASILTSSFKSGKTLPANAVYKSEVPGKSAVKIPSQVSFAVKADSLDRCGDEFDGAYRVVANILSLDYLWSAVRVRGGAYGAGMSVASNGTMFCYSYRDPSPDASLVAYDAAADYLEKFASENDDLDKYIISEVASGDPLHTPKAEGAAADVLYLSGVTDDMRKKTRGEMLRTSPDSLRRFAVSLRHMAESGRISVVGGAIDGCKGLETVEI